LLIIPYLFLDPDEFQEENPNKEEYNGGLGNIISKFFYYDLRVKYSNCISHVVNLLFICLNLFYSSIDFVQQNLLRQFENVDGKGKQIKTRSSENPSRKDTSLSDDGKCVNNVFKYI